MNVCVNERYVDMNGSDVYIIKRYSIKSQPWILLIVEGSQLIPSNPKSIRRPRGPNRAALQSSFTEQLYRAALQSSPTEQLYRVAIQSSFTEQPYRAALQSSPTEQLYRAALQSSFTESPYRAGLQSSPKEQLYRIALPSSFTEQPYRAALQSIPKEQLYRVALQNSLTEQPYRGALQSTLQSRFTGQPYRAALQSSPTEQLYRAALQSSFIEQPFKVALHSSPTELPKRILECCTGTSVHQNYCEKTLLLFIMCSSLHYCVKNMHCNCIIVQKTALQLYQCVKIVNKPNPRAARETSCLYSRFTLTSYVFTVLEMKWSSGTASSLHSTAARPQVRV